MGVIVVGYVPKPEGEAALTRAVAEAKLRDSRLVVLHSNRGGRDIATPEENAAIEEQLERVRDQLKPTGVEFEVRQLVRGLEPAEDLIQLAEDESADLIVIGLRRRTPLGKLILGSNAQQILLEASCPVLAVKA